MPPLDLFPQRDDGPHAKAVLKEFALWRSIDEDDWPESRVSWHRRLRAARYEDFREKAGTEHEHHAGTVET